jgi:hypothetical protein
VDDALSGDCLAGPQAIGFEQQGPRALADEIIEQPKSGRPSAKNQHIDLHRHNFPSGNAAANSRRLGEM